MHSLLISIVSRLFISCAILLGIGANIHAQSSFPWQEGRKAAISLSFDDARTSHPEVGKDLFRKLNAQATFYVIPDAVENHLADWKEIVADGHEIGPEGKQTTEIQMLEELVAYVQAHEEDIWLATVGEVTSHIQQVRAQRAADLKEALMFGSTFDEGFEADFAKGDPQIYGLPKFQPQAEGVANMVPEEIGLAEGKGLFGNALEFKRKGRPVVFYQAKDNITYNESDWNGTISFWLSLDPEKDLEPGFTDPVQITDSGYDDAGLWVDFTKENPRSFRMGFYGDKKVWNPENKPFDENPDYEKRLIVAKNPSFQRGKWTHVVMKFEGLNTGEGRGYFYINGQLEDTRLIEEPFTWELEKAKIHLGLNFVGMMDEVAIFDRALTSEEVKTLYELPGGIGELLE